ncbi:protein TSSC4 isoform X3 [Serinus canaria]|uniref:protein TSSC4 isoform X3 n=1 Tax=Serinus canaria TaxID=9135 RepID=UPI0021CC4F01|nr:protein TSSC4 isoform X3 [Serinus canaria]
MSALRCALGAVVPPLSTASLRSPARKMSSAEARRPPTTPRSPKRGGAARRRRPFPRRSPRRELWSCRRCGRSAEPGRDSVSRRSAGRGRRGRGGSRKAHRVCLSNTGMEEPTGSLPIRRDVILPESCCGHVTITNLVEVLRSLVALTDPQEGKLTQSQEKALSSLGIWESVFRVVPGPTSKTSVE